jgi:hypothetical protein
MPVEMATRNANIFVLAIVDGPAEKSVLDTVLDLFRKEMAELSPPSADELERRHPEVPGNSANPHWLPGVQHMYPAACAAHDCILIRSLQS